MRGKSVGGHKSRYETYLIPGETLIPGGRGKGERFTLVLDMRHIYLSLMKRVLEIMVKEPILLGYEHDGFEQKRKRKAIKTFHCGKESITGPRNAMPKRS